MFNYWYDFYKDHGIKLIMDIGQDDSGGGNIGAAYAQAYLTSHGYSEGVIGAVDPNWQQMNENVSPIGSALPYFAVFDGDMNIMGADMTSAAVVQALEQITGVSLPMTCEGFCGSQAVSGCFCDSACVDYDDCCPDACDLCGVDCG